MVTAFIGLGSNLGDRLGHLSRAVEAVADLPETHVERVSRAYESQPAYVTDQPPFANAVIQVATGLEPPALLGYLLDIETQLGRVREVDQGPRSIDLDLLLFGDDEWNSEQLTLPHPGLLERSFVVTPLLEIAPHVTMPDGTHPRRAKTTVGPVTADLGPIPDTIAAHDVPVQAGDWVEVAESSSANDAIIGFDASLALVHEVLEQEGIPVAWDPYQPGTDMDSFGMTITFKLLVPELYVERARVLAEEVAAAPPDFPPELVE